MSPRRGGTATAEPVRAYSDRDALLRAILAEPAEDTPRLVFADWLDEHGEPARAETIREQIAWARGAPWTPGACVRISEEDAWLNFPAERRAIHWLWDRGFLSRVDIKLVDFLAHAEAIFRVHPVTDVRLTDRHPWFNPFRTWTWTWGSSGAAADSHLIPIGWLDELPRGRNWQVTRSQKWQGYYREQDAHAALSFAAVNVGRKLAGLTPFPEPEPT